MPLSLYSATVPHFLQVLPQMALLIDRAEAHCAGKGLPPEALLGAKLAEDMWPLSWQFRACWSHSADAVESTLSGERLLDFGDVPSDFDYLRRQIDGAIVRLRTTRPADVDLAEDNEVSFTVRDKTYTFTGLDYLLKFALPNFFFHSTTAYAILRNQGVAISKGDYLGALPLKS
jgi:uncharacterized protein